MKTSFGKYLSVPLLAAVFVGCADSGQGGAADTESGLATSPAPLIDPSEPGVAPEPGTTPTISTGYVAETPARPVAPDPATTQPSDTGAASQTQAAGQGELNEQGAQRSPEPQTGDDANPDNVNPRE